MSSSTFETGLGDVQSEETKSLGSIDNPLSVLELTELVKVRLESEFSYVAVVGEVSNFKPHPSGHFYFSLKDEGAAISAVMFRGANQKLKFKLQDGQKVIAIGRLSVYPPRGSYQIVISRLEPAGVGALQLAFEQLKKKLEAEGLFDSKRKRALPSFPKTIGIVTAPQGAAIRDMLHVLDRRFAGVHILIHPVKVQGAQAAQEIADAIRELNRCFPEIDVMIVGRGGGSIEDLWAFNEEVVARAIFESKIPIISAVGHEIDFTIADFVADVRAPTPSAAAEIVVASKIEVFNHLDHLVRRLLQVRKQVELVSMRLDDLMQRLVRAIEDGVSSKLLVVEKYKARLAQLSPVVRLQAYRHRLVTSISDLKFLVPALLERKNQRVESLHTKLRLLNPRAIMERGYSIVRIEKSGHVVKKASDVRMGDKLLIELSKGRITAKV